jgi:hypothetical protein
MADACAIACRSGRAIVCAVVNSALNAWFWYAIRDAPGGENSAALGVE